jgi:hypothetical protein
MGYPVSPEELNTVLFYEIFIQKSIEKVVRFVEKLGQPKIAISTVNIVPRMV